MKNILLIVYYWPPLGGPGVKRWVNYTRELSKDFKIYIFTPKKNIYNILDNSINELNKNNNNIQLIRYGNLGFLKIVNNYTYFKSFLYDWNSKNYSNSYIFKLLVFIRGNFFIPDPKIFWCIKSFLFLIKFLKMRKIDIIISTGPPHSLHLLNICLSFFIKNIKTVVDFRDPWTHIHYHEKLKLTKFSKYIHYNLEKIILRKSNLVLSTSYHDNKIYLSRGGNSKVITNGYNIFNFKYCRTNKFTDYFNIIYTGNMDFNRNPLNLWEALNIISKTDKIFKRKLIISFYGIISDDVINSINNQGLYKNLKIYGYIDYYECLNKIKEANLLLITTFSNNKYKGIIPGKIFDYMPNMNPILGIGCDDSDVKYLLNKTKTGEYFNYNDKDNIIKFILDVYKGTYNYNPNLYELEKYQYKYLSKKLHLYLNSMYV